MKMLVGACGSNVKGDGGLWGWAKCGCDVVVVGIWVWWCWELGVWGCGGCAFMYFYISIHIESIYYLFIYLWHQTYVKDCYTNDYVIINNTVRIGGANAGRYQRYGRCGR